jgi:tetratricopeptide (TPR) repeat protein
MTRDPNLRLAAAMAEVGISNKGLAALVRAVLATQDGGASVDHTYVKRWLDGGQPGTSTAEAVALVLSRKLGRRLTPAEIGFAKAPSSDSDFLGDGVRYAGGVEASVVLLDQLTSADLRGDKALEAVPWTPDAAPGLVTGYLFGRPRDAIEPVLALSAVSPADRIRTTLRHLADLDFRFGGGHTKGMLLFYWKNEIVPLLRQRHTERTRREVFAAAADAAEVLGWSAYDAGHQGLAQRYFAQGLRLADEAQDGLMGGQLLANLSHQANYLGGFTEAVQLARAAQAATAKRPSATVSSMFYAMEARALASLGDVRGCETALRTAEQMFGRRKPGDDPDWIGYFDEYELAGEAAHCYRDLGLHAKAQESALRAIDPAATPERTQVFILMVQAVGALGGSGLDEALSLATGAVERAGSLTSSRYLRYLADFRTLAGEKHRDDPALRAFDEMLRARKVGSILKRMPA